MIAWVKRHDRQIPKNRRTVSAVDTLTVAHLVLSIVDRLRRRAVRYLCRNWRFSTGSWIVFTVYIIVEFFCRARNTPMSFVTIVLKSTIAYLKIVRQNIRQNIILLSIVSQWILRFMPTSDTKSKATVEFLRTNFILVLLYRFKFGFWPAKHVIFGWFRNCILVTRGI